MFIKWLWLLVDTFERLLPREEAKRRTEEVSIAKGIDSTSGPASPYTLRCSLFSYHNADIFNVTMTKIMLTITSAIL